MTSHVVLHLALTAILVTVTLANLENRSITDDSGESSETQDKTWLWRPTFWINGSLPDSGASGQWPVAVGILQKWLLDSLTKKDEIILKKDELLLKKEEFIAKKDELIYSKDDLILRNIEILNEKEKELCELRAKIKQLETMRDVTGGAMTSHGDLKDGLTSQGREMTKLRCEQTEREIRGLQVDHEALINRSVQLQTENLSSKFQINELNISNWHLKLRIEGCRNEIKLLKDSNCSENFHLSSQQYAEITKQQQCRDAKIAELKMVKYANQYYYFSEQTLLKTWHEAFSFCKSHGLNLVTVESAEENNFITSHLLQLYGSGWNHFYWLGGNDLSTEGRWVWSSTGQPLTFNSWASGQPDGGQAQNCMLTHFRTSYRHLWYDDPCTEKLAFICEMKKEACN